MPSKLSINVNQQSGKISKNGVGPKPYGFWYAFGDGWVDFTRNDYTNAYHPHLYHVYVESRRILQLTTLGDLYDFTRRYKLPNDEDSYLQNYNMNWVNVASDYDGIEIFPYIKEARFNEDVRWYYGWDVASGCVWDSDLMLKYMGNTDTVEL